MKIALKINRNGSMEGTAGLLNSTTTKKNGINGDAYRTVNRNPIER